MNWSLPKLLSSLHDDIHNRLETVRNSIAHPTAKGDGSEAVWIDLLNKYLPRRYCATKAFIVDSEGKFSQQIDIVVYDRQYCPLIFEYEGTTVVPAESVYAIFEAKQEIDATQIRYAQEKAASVRRLHRTSLPIPHAGGQYGPKPLHPILAGIVTFDSSWTPPLGDSLLAALNKGTENTRIGIGCVAAHGYMIFDAETDCYTIEAGGKHATAFLLRLITLLQASATVPMIDVQAYAAWLAK